MAVSAGRLGDRLDRAPRHQQCQRRGDPVDRALEGDGQRRFAGRGDHAGVAFEIQLASRELGAVELAPGLRQPAHDGVEQSLGQRPVDFGQVSLGGGLRGLSAEQAFERLQHPGQLDAQQQRPLRAALLDRHREGVRRQAHPCGGPHVLGDLADRDLDLGFQLRRQFLRQRVGERGQGGRQVAADVGRELGRLGEVEPAGAGLFGSRGARLGWSLAALAHRHSLSVSRVGCAAILARGRPAARRPAA